MTRPARSGRASGAACAAVLVAVGGWSAPSRAGGAQAVPDPPVDSIRAVVELREQDYDVASADYRYAYASHSQLEDEWDRLNDDLDIARESLTNTERSQRLAQLQELSVQVERAQARAESRKEIFLDAGAALVSALEQHLDALSRLLRDAPTPERAQELGDLYRDRSNRVGQVEDEMATVGGRIPLVLDPLPQFAIDPGDTPRQIMQMARFLDGEADQHERLMADLASEIERLQKRLDRDRATADFFADPNRLADIRLPVTTGSSGAGVGERQQGDETLAERIENLAAFLAVVEVRKEQLRQKAGQFRERAGGTA